MFPIVEIYYRLYNKLVAICFIIFVWNFTFSKKLLQILYSANYARLFLIITDWGGVEISFLLKTLHQYEITFVLYDALRELHMKLYLPVMEWSDVDVFPQNFIFYCAFNRLPCHFQRSAGMRVGVTISNFTRQRSANNWR